MKDYDKAAQATVKVRREFYGKTAYEELTGIDGVFYSPVIDEYGDPICMLVDLRKVNNITIELTGCGWYCNMAEMASGDKIWIVL